MIRRSVSVSRCWLEIKMKILTGIASGNFLRSAEACRSVLVVCLLITCVISRARAHERNSIRNVKDLILDKTPRERQLFHLRKNGLKVDVRVVPASFGNDSTRNEHDHFPEFPAKEIGECIVEFSLGCIRKRLVRFLDTVGRLDEITLLGQDVKLIRSRHVRRSDGAARAINDSDVSIGRTVDDFFNSFTLRISLPRWNGKREKNQIDVMLDETAVAEGRKKGGGGGGGGGCGGGKGGKCMMMMMGMLMMVKMKLLGLAAIKGMMMGGMAMMSLLMQKLGKGGGGGPWQSGGGGGGPWQSGGQLKEIVLLTKSSSGGGGGGGCCGPSSYSAPPSSSYGAPSGGGGGWGRSFHKRPMTLSYDGTIKTANDFNRTNEATSKSEYIDYPDYQDYRESSAIANSNLTTFHWNTTSDIAFYRYGDDVDSVRNSSQLKSTTDAEGRRRLTFDENLSNSKIDINNERGVELTTNTNTNQSDSMEDTNLAYADEWQPVAGQMSRPGDVSSSNSNAIVELRRTEPRSRDVPLLRGI